MRRLLSTIMVAALFVAACGKSEAEKQAEQAAEDMTQAQQAGGDTAKGMADMAKAMQGMAAAVGGSADGKPVEPVATDTLKGTLPQIAGWEMGDPRTER